MPRRAALHGLGAASGRGGARHGAPPARVRRALGRAIGRALGGAWESQPPSASPETGGDRGGDRQLEQGRDDLEPVAAAVREVLRAEAARPTGPVYGRDWLLWGGEVGAVSVSPGSRAGLRGRWSTGSSTTHTESSRPDDRNVLFSGRAPMRRPASGAGPVESAQRGYRGAKSKHF
jgi:hypothetical protein